MNKTFIFSLIASTLIAFIYSSCGDKEILNTDYTLKYSSVKDYKLAYNDAASCATFSTGNDYTTCCYIKLKFENLMNEEKYTHTGCYELNITSLLDDASLDVETIIDNLETAFNSANKNSLESKDIDIDCGSKYIHLASLALLILLL